MPCHAMVVSPAWSKNSFSHLPLPQRDNQIRLFPGDLYSHTVSLGPVPPLELPRADQLPHSSPSYICPGTDPIGNFPKVIPKKKK